MRWPWRGRLLLPAAWGLLLTPLLPTATTAGAFGAGEGDLLAVTRGVERPFDARGAKAGAMAGAMGVVMAGAMGVVMAGAMAVPRDLARDGAKLAGSRPRCCCRCHERHLRDEIGQAARG